MKSFLAAALAAFLVTVTPAFPQTSAHDIRSLDVSRLTAEQKAQLLAHVSKLQESKSANMSETVRTEAEKWGELGANTGKAVVAAAKEVGVAANDFAQTPLGKVVTVIVVYKMIGQDALGIVIGLLVLFAGTCAFVFVFRSRYFGDHDLERVPALGGLITRTRVVRWHESGEATASRVALSVGILALSWIIGLNIIL
jgi:hypothetical protein